MQITSSFSRYEKKYLLTVEQKEELLGHIGEYIQADAYSMGNAMYRICNIYFDTENSDVIRYSLSSPFYKEKLRLRTYDTPKSMDQNAFLEIKKKVNRLVLKRRATLTLGQAYEFLETRRRPQALSYINNQVLDEIEYYLAVNPVRPAVYIAYDRAAYYDKNDPSLRITFDKNIITRRDDLYLEHGVHGQNLLGENEWLMEIKVSSAMPLWLARPLVQMGLFPRSFSKYGTEYANTVNENRDIKRNEDSYDD